MNILILDDDYDRAQDWKREIGAILEDKENIIVYSNDQVTALISKLHQQRLRARSGDYETVAELDNFDLLIVDYDLLGLDADGRSAWSTGAEVAYAARLMSTVGPIVVVNQYGTNSFDLTLKKTASSYADLDLGSKHITNRNLWAQDEFDGFRPWHWPNLYLEPSRLNDLSEFVRHNLDAPILSSLGIEPQNYDSPRYISPELLSQLGVGRDNNMTFKQLLAGTQKDDGAYVTAQIGVFNILEKDLALVRNMPDEITSRVGATILSHWIEKLVLPNQELIADIPHLAFQYPWILRDYDNSKSWHNIARLDGTEHLIEGLDRYQVNPPCLASRPVYWTGEIKRSLGLPLDFSMSKVPNLVFCEDASVFEHRERCTSFPSDLHTLDRERWIRNDLTAGGEMVNYEPQAYLLM